jgi:phage terminase large subunit-like protein
MIPDYRIQKYIDLVRKAPYKMCEEQYQLCDIIEKIFETEELVVDSEQLDKYLAFQKYFPFDLLDWEVFCFALHNCVYKKNGQLRFPVLLIYVGRGAGKNGYLGFEDFCLLTPVNGIKHYNIDIFAMSEQQSKTSFKDVYNVLEENKSFMKKYFKWTKEVITNIKTGSEFAFNTSNPKTKDGFRPGKVDFDEYHAYENMKLVDVAVTGLGKVPFPRRTIVTTDGDVRDGPLDTMLDKSRRILSGELPDNGMIPFICRIKNKDDIKDPENWPMANPSYPYFANLQEEMKLEYDDYVIDPLGNASFATKRCNCPGGAIREDVVTDWKNIKATNIIIPQFEHGTNAVGGLDYASTEDFVSAAILVIQDGIDYVHQHTWICEASKDLPRIKAPLREWERRGLCEFVKGPEISPDLPAQWFDSMNERFNILKIGIDKYRYTLMSKALAEYGFLADKDGKIKIVRPSDEMQLIPTLTSLFNNNRIAVGDDPMMRWCINNSKRVTSSAGNMTYGKIEPKSRKTDAFKALVAAEICRDELIAMNEINQTMFNTMNVYTY